MRTGGRGLPMGFVVPTFRLPTAMVMVVVGGGWWGGKLWKFEVCVPAKIRHTLSFLNLN